MDTSFTFRFKQLWNAPPNGLYGVESVERLRRAVGVGLPVRLGGDLLLRACGRRVHHRDDEDRGDPDRDRPPRAALPAQRLGPGRDPDGGLRARRHHLRDVGGDARLLRPARAAGARARLRPHGRGGDHLPRRGRRRDRLDGQPVRDRRRLGRRRDQHRRRDRTSDRAVGRARRAARSPTSSGTRAASRGPGEVGRRRVRGRRRRRGEPRHRRARSSPVGRRSCSRSSAARSC